MKRNYALPESGRNKSATIMPLMKRNYALPDSRIQCQPWLYYSWNINTHFLIIERDENKSALMVLWMEWNYAPTERWKWREQVSHDCAANEKDLKGITHCLRVERGRTMSAIIVLLAKWKYALPDNQKWREQVSLDGAANEMELRTVWESKVAGTC